MGGKDDRHPRALPVAVTAVTIAGLCLLGGIGAAAASTATASAASSAHWRIVERTNSELGSIVVPSAASAWVFGQKAGASFASLPSGVRWNGHRWSPVTFPKKVRSGIACAAATSPRDVWAFAGSSLFGDNASYAGALRLSGARWVVKKTFPAGIVTGCTVLSPTNAWIYGTSHVAPGAGTWRLKGRTWRLTKTGSFALIYASEVSARGMWAIATDQVGNDDVIAHWNGRSWRSDASFAAALPAQSSTLTWDVTAINAVRAGDVWVAGQIFRNSVASNYVLHLSGGKWHKVARSNPGYYLPDAVSDGHGGWWALGTRQFSGGNPSAKPYLLHRSGARWHRVTIAAPRGYKMQVGLPVHVPGSRAMLALGSLDNGTTALRSVVLAYGNLPK